MRLCLELNPKSVSAAVSTYVEHKTRQLSDQKNYDARTCEAVLQHLPLHGHVGGFPDMITC